MQGNASQNQRQLSRSEARWANIMQATNERLMQMPQILRQHDWLAKGSKSKKRASPIPTSRSSCAMLPKSNICAS